MFLESDYTIVLEPNDRLRVFYSYQEDDEKQEVNIRRIFHNGRIVNVDDLDEYYHRAIDTSIRLHLLEATHATVH